MAVPFFRMECGEDELANVERVLRSGWLTTGEWAHRFEREFAEAVGAKHALAVNSCTAALHLALEAVGIGQGDHVLVPSLTFAATAEVVRYLGAKPILADVDPETGCLTTRCVEQAAMRTTLKAVIPVHFAGYPADIPSLRKFCDPRGIAVVEDAAHAFPTRLAGSRIGTHSAATCFSFYANKTITTGEGGMVTTEDDALASRMRLMRLHGMDRDAWNRYRSTKPAWQYDIMAPGYKYNLSDLAAAVGVAQLAKSDQMHARRVDLALRYLRNLAGTPGVTLPACPNDPSDHAWHLFIVRIAQTPQLTRDSLIEALAANAIGTSVHYRPLHRMTYYAKLTGANPSDLPIADAWGEKAVSLPLFSSMRDEECDYVAATLKRVVCA